MVEHFSISWNRDENDQFEEALSQQDGCAEPDWNSFSFPGEPKTGVELKQHFDKLVDDVDDIEAGRVQVPEYVDVVVVSSDGGGSSCTRKRYERRRGQPWTEDEHRQFLMGLERYGKSDWKSISRFCVKTRTPTQVASHAQKYFIRLESAGKKEKRRNSIHDITSAQTFSHHGDDRLQHGNVERVSPWFEVQRPFQQQQHQLAFLPRHKLERPFDWFLSPP